MKTIVTATDCESSFVKGASYGDGVCTVELLNGNRYQYTGVTRREFANFARCKSAGYGFNRHIRNHPFVRIG